MAGHNQADVMNPLSPTSDVMVHKDVVGHWTPGWRPRCGWCGPWRLDRRGTVPVWTRPVRSAKPIYFAGPPVLDHEADS